MHHMVAIFYFTRLVSTNLLKSSQIGVWKRFLFRFPFMHSFCNLPAHTTRELWLCTLFCGYTLYNQNRVMSKAAGAIDTTLQKNALHRMMPMFLPCFWMSWSWNILRIYKFSSSLLKLQYYIWYEFMDCRGWSWAKDQTEYPQGGPVPGLNGVRTNPHK